MTTSHVLDHDLERMTQCVELHTPHERNIAVLMQSELTGSWYTYVYAAGGREPVSPFSSQQEAETANYRYADALMFEAREEVLTLFNSGSDSWVGSTLLLPFLLLHNGVNTMQKVKFNVKRVKLSDLNCCCLSAYDQEAARQTDRGQLQPGYQCYCAPQGGSMYIIDGQHQAEALRQLGYDYWPCHVTESTGRAHEAELFRICNSAKTRKQVTPLELYRALLVEGDKTARQCHATIKQYGFETGGAGPRTSRLSVVFND